MKALTALSNKSITLDKHLKLANDKIDSLQVRNATLVEENKKLKKVESDATRAQTAMSAKIAALEKSHEKASADLLASGKQNQTIVAERNSLRQKCQSLAKDMARLTKNNRSVKEIEKMISCYEELQLRTSILKAEKKHAVETMLE